MKSKYKVKPFAKIKAKINKDTKIEPTLRQLKNKIKKPRIK